MANFDEIKQKIDTDINTNFRQNITGRKLNIVLKSMLDFVDKVFSDGLSEKQNNIADLDAIRQGASKGATALQSVPDEYVTEQELEGKGYATKAQLNGKQDTISDLEVIRENAAKGTTAIQRIPDEYVTEQELNIAIEDAITKTLNTAV